MPKSQKWAVSIEKDNPSLKEIIKRLRKRQELDKTKIGRTYWSCWWNTLGDKSRSKDILGERERAFLDVLLEQKVRVVESFTPQSVVKLLVRMEP